MILDCPRSRMAAVCAVAAVSALAAALYAQDEWRTMAALPGVDMAGLAPAQRAAALKILREHACPCGCDMKIAECRVKDPNCSYSKGFAGAFVDALRAGKPAAKALAAADASRFGHVPVPKLLEDAVAIPVAGAPIIGPADARVTLVEFSDFQCPYCLKAFAQIKAVLAAYPKDVKLIFKEFPLERHSQAAAAAAAALAAHHQGKFWPMHDALFAAHADLSRASILRAAGGIGLDMKRFTAEMDAPATRREVQRDQADGEKAGVEGTPTLFIDGRRYNGSLELTAIRPVLNAELKPVAKHR